VKRTQVGLDISDPVVGFFKGCHEKVAAVPAVSTLIMERCFENLVVRFNDGTELQILALGNNMDLMAVDYFPSDRQVLSLAAGG
tara:strand:- start:447 stop:698 length:252 start_codon:yes stop_codon:yes gene_type:complete